MFKKRWKATLAAISMAALMACGSATPAFAYTDENAETNTESVVVVEESTEESTESEDTSEDRDVSGALTPDGNLTLVDDLDEDASKAMQFMTVTTRDGSYYYIIIDRSGTNENVYFLNAVDTVDLMRLMSDDEKAELAEKVEPEQEQVVTPIIQDQEEPVDDNEVVPEKENKTASSLPILGVFLALGALVAGGYYMLKIKPKKGQTGIDEDREFYDDDEYENEDDMILIDENSADDDTFDFGDENEEE